MLYEISAGSCILLVENLETVSRGSDAGELRLRCVLGPQVMRQQCSPWHVTHSFACKGEVTTYRKR